MATTWDWIAALLGVLPLLIQLLWSWNDLRFWLSLKVKESFNKGYAADVAATKLLPGHMGLPFVGETFRFLWYFKVVRRPDLFIASKKDKYGEGVGMYRSHLFGSPSVITCSVASNKMVFRSPEKFRIRWTGGGVLVGKNSMNNPNGARHARLKAFVLGAVNQPASFARITAALQERLAVALPSWAEKRTVVAYQEIKKMTFECTCKIFVSIEPGPHLDKIRKLFHGVVPGIRAVPLYFPGTTFYHAVQCRRKLAAVFREELMKRKGAKVHDRYRDRDLMDGLMELKDEHGKQLTDDEVVDNTVSLVLGGYESISVTATWALYLLAKSPHVLQRLREENSMLDKKGMRDLITAEEISTLKYTEMVVKEVIRMANIAPFVFREATGDVNYKGYLIPKGWQIIVWVRNVRSDPNNYEDPLNFNPERWNEPEKPGTFQVFGLGNRICAGNQLARLELAIFVHHLVLGYEWELLNPDAEISYLPHPLPVDGVTLEFHSVQS